VASDRENSTRCPSTFIQNARKCGVCGTAGREGGQSPDQGANERRRCLFRHRSRLVVVQVRVKCRSSAFRTVTSDVHIERYRIPQDSVGATNYERCTRNARAVPAVAFLVPVRHPQWIVCLPTGCILADGTVDLKTPRLLSIVRLWVTARCLCRCGAP
jgi:hypothetical protein